MFNLIQMKKNVNVVVSKVLINNASNICMELGYIRDLPSWVAVDWQSTWENALSHDYTEIDCDCSDYTYGHIFSNNY